MKAHDSRRFEGVFVNHEGLIFRRGQIYAESFAHDLFADHYRRPSRFAWFLLKNYWLRRGAVPVGSGLWVIDNLAPSSYYHWTTECLPRLLLAEEQYPDEHLLLLPRSYQRDPYIPYTLRAFPRVTEIGWIGEHTKARVAHMAYVPQARPSTIFIPELMREVAHRVSRLVGKPGRSERIYFSRADAGRRRAANENDVEKILRSHAFEIIRIEPAHPDQQIRASAGAAVMAGVHGADLTNLMYMAPGGKVLEFRHPREEVFGDCYRPLSVAMGHEYHAQMCQPVREAKGRDINHVDVVVDLDILRENLRAIAP